MGITRIDSALNRWTLSYNVRTIIASQTREMMKLTHEGENDDYIHSECTKSRMVKDDVDEARLLDSLNGLSLFGENGDILKHIVMKDLVTSEIQESLLNAETLGKEQMKVFINQRLFNPQGSEKHISINHPCRRIKE